MDYLSKTQCEYLKKIGFDIRKLYSTWFLNGLSDKYYLANNQDIILINKDNDLLEKELKKQDVYLTAFDCMIEAFLGYQWLLSYEIILRFHPQKKQNGFRAKVSGKYISNHIFEKYSDVLFEILCYVVINQSDRLKYEEIEEELCYYKVL